MTTRLFGEVTLCPVVAGAVEFAAAVRLAILREQPEVVAVPLARELMPALTGAVLRLPEMSAVAYVYGIDPDDEQYAIVEPCDPIVEALRTAREIGARIEFLLEEPVWGDRPFDYSAHAAGAALPDTYTAARYGAEHYVNEALNSGACPEEEPRLVALLTRALQGLDASSSTLVVVPLTALSALQRAFAEPVAEPEPVARRAIVSMRVVNLHPESLVEICRVPPFYTQRYERWRERAEELNSAREVDRLAYQRELTREAEVNYQAQANETLASWQRRQMARYSRKLAATSGVLLADLFDLVTAARGVADDNYAWELWHAAGEWAAQREESEVETVRLRSEDLAPHVRHMRLRRMPLSEKRMLLPRGLKDRPKERFPGEWASQIDGDAICSYPPEDLVIEDYGRLLRQKARTMLTDERSRVERFSTSLGDGVDVRETLRHWHKREIWVRHNERGAGDVGAVVVVFDEDSENRYTYCTTWLGEHQNESDMAFYSTQPFDHMIGPGIGRAEYGGFLMILPSHRMYNVWEDPDYRFAESKAEVLLLAAIDYSLERHVVYVAAKPPRSVFRTIAARLGRSILYVPLGQLSPERLKRIRVVHVLDGHHRRAQAKDYLW